MNDVHEVSQEAPRRGRPPKVNPKELTVARPERDTSIGQPRDFESSVDLDSLDFSGLRVVQLPFGCDPEKFHYRFFPTEKASRAGGTAHFSSEDRIIMATCQRTGAGEPVSPKNHPDIDPSMFVDGKYYDPQQENCLWYMSKEVMRKYYATNDQAVAKLKQMKAMRDPAPPLGGGALGFSEIGGPKPSEGRRDISRDGQQIKL